MNWVRGVLRTYGLEREFENQQVLLLWPKVAGEQTARVAQATEFSHGVLTVSVSSSTVMHELSLLRRRYIERINQLIGDPRVQELRFIPGQIPQRRTITLPPPNHAHLAEAETLFSTVTDPRLRQSFLRLYETLRRREEALLAAGGKRCVRCGVVFFGEGDLCPGCRFDQFADVRPKD